MNHLSQLSDMCCGTSVGILKGHREATCLFHNPPCHCRQIEGTKTEKKKQQRRLKETAYCIWEIIDFRRICYFRSDCESFGRILESIPAPVLWCPIAGKITFIIRF